MSASMISHGKPVIVHTTTPIRDWPLRDAPAATTNVQRKARKVERANRRRGRK